MYNRLLTWRYLARLQVWQGWRPDDLGRQVILAVIKLQPDGRFRWLTASFEGDHASFDLARTYATIAAMDPDLLQRMSDEAKRIAASMGAPPSWGIMARSIEPDAWGPAVLGDDGDADDGEPLPTPEADQLLRDLDLPPWA